MSQIPNQYLVRPFQIKPFTRYECYLLAITDLNWGRSKVKCELLGTDDNGMSVKFEGYIIRDIISPFELDLKMKAKAKQNYNRKLKVVVYGMEFRPWPTDYIPARQVDGDWIHSSREYQPFSFVPAMGCYTPDFAVVDYFE